MTFIEKLFNEIGALQCNVFTDKLLAKKLKLYSTFEKQEVKRALTELVNEGKLVSVGDGQYSLASKSELRRGTLRGNRRGFAFFVGEDGGKDLFIPHRGLKGALHGDTVFAKQVRGTVDEGEVVSVVTRGARTIVGTLQVERNGSGFVIPDDDGYYTDIYVPSTRKNGAKNHEKVVVKIVDFEGGKNPLGEVTDILGKADTVKGDTLAIIRSHGFRECFPTNVVQEAERLAAPISERELVGRTDYSKLLTITIDGEDARDFDDAVSVEKTADGYILYVHIADVAHYVKQGSVIDNEALKRATSVYLPNMVLPMLPEQLSNGMCSLKENEIRLTLTIEMELDKGGTLKKQKLSESYIKSNHRMTYTKVTKILDGDEELNREYADIVGMLKDMAELAAVLNKKRKARGSINFQSRESKIILNEKDEVVSVERYPYEQSNNIIEEFMLAANETVAEFMFHTQLPFVYRVHEAPSKEKLEVFKQFAAVFGYKFIIRQTVYPMQFQELLDELKGKPEEGIISKVMLRSMQKAKYTVNNLGHFGLAADYYCHFTSPIRRYPDLMIHRVIKAMLEGKLSGAAVGRTEAACDKAAAVSSEREIAAEQAERDADDYFKMLYMTDKVGNVYDGYISGVTGFGIFVELQNTVEGLVSLDNLPGEGKYDFIEKRYLLKGNGRTFSLGDKVTVKVVGVDKAFRRVNFVLYEKE